MYRPRVLFAKGDAWRAVACVDRRTKKAFEVPAPIAIVAAGALQSRLFCYGQSCIRFRRVI